MRFVFDERKTAQAAAHLLGLHGGTMFYIALIKLLYLSDRETLIHTGQPITGDGMVSMKNGPVLSRTYELISIGPLLEDSPWYQYISGPNNYQVSSIKDNPETDELSIYELKVLKAVHEKYGWRDRWDLVKWTHSLPEWENPGNSCLSIDPGKILRSAGKSPEEIESVTRDAEELWSIDRLMSAEKR